MDAAVGIALDFDGQGAFAGGGRWDATTTRLRVEALLGVADAGMFDARMAVTVGAGARFTAHDAHVPGAERSVVVVGATARVAPELAIPAGPGRFAVSLPLDVGVDMPGPVSGFAPLAAGISLGYRLEL